MRSIIGNNYDGTINNVYVTGSIVSKAPRSYVGGIVAANRTSISDFYWDNTVTSTGVSSNIGASTNVDGLTTSEMQGSTASENMNALDFTNIWTTSSGYPELR